jgi:hypothetical protein
MRILTHLCGQELEHSNGLHRTYFQLTRPDNHGSFATQVERCPRCNELLYETDMRDRIGMPLVIDTPSEPSLARRAALAALALAGYQLHWDDGRWCIRPVDGGHDIVSCDTLDGLVELAQAISVNQIPIRLYCSSGGLEQIWEGLYSVVTGTAIGHAGDGSNQRISVMIEGDQVQVRTTRDAAPLIGRVQQQTSALIEAEFRTEVVGDTECQYSSLMTKPRPAS